MSQVSKLEQACKDVKGTVFSTTGVLSDFSLWTSLGKSLHVTGDDIVFLDESVISNVHYSKVS